MCANAPEQACKACGPETGSGLLGSLGRRRRSSLLPFFLLLLLAMVLMVMLCICTCACACRLLDSFTIPVAVALSAVMLGARYRGGHYTGAAVCLTGLALLVLTDQSTGSGGSTGSSGGSSGGGGAGGDEGRTWLGDALVLLGATLYACCNVLAERLLGEPERGKGAGCRRGAAIRLQWQWPLCRAITILRRSPGRGGSCAAPSSPLCGRPQHSEPPSFTPAVAGDVSVQELLAMQGLWGLAITCVVVLPLELPTLLAAHWTAAAALPFLGFGLVGGQPGTLYEASSVCRCLVPLFNTAAIDSWRLACLA